MYRYESLHFMSNKISFFLQDLILKLTPQVSCICSVLHKDGQVGWNMLDNKFSMWIDMLFLIQFMPDVVYLAAGKSNSTGHVGTSHHVSQDDSSSAISCKPYCVDELKINYNS